MKTQVIRMDGSQVDRAAVERAAELLRGGGLVAFPTETVYGVGACADRPEGVARLRQLKRRPNDKAFTVHLAEPDEATRYVPDFGGTAARLARKGWPGPMTLIVAVPEPPSAPVLDGLPPSAAEAMYYNGTVGLRCPDDPIAREIFRLAGSPVIATSANRGGEPPAIDGRDALAALDGEIELLIDTGETKYARASTVVRVEGDRYTVEREGVYDQGIIDRLSKVRILFVCTGNTCRSPMAEGLASRLIAERLGVRPGDLSDRGVVIESAGIAGGFGKAAEHAVSVMKKRGVDISAHVSRKLSADTVRQADYVFVMTREHQQVIEHLAPGGAERVRLLLDDGDLVDPVGGGEEDYERCAASIEAGLRSRLTEVVL